MQKRYFWKGVVTGVILFLLLTVFLYNKYIKQPDLELDQIEVLNLEGDKVDLKEYMGKPLVVNFWATWCAPCIEEFPYFQELKETLEASVNFVMISDEDLNKITKFSNFKPYSFTYLRSPKNFQHLGIIARPVTYFYNSKGILVTKFNGSINAKKLKELVKKIKQ